MIGNGFRNLIFFRPSSDQTIVKAGNAAIFEVYALPAFTNVASLNSVTTPSYTFERLILVAERPKVYIHL